MTHMTKNIDKTTLVPRSLYWSYTAHILSPTQPYHAPQEHVWCGSSWHTCPMNGRPSKIRGTPEKALGIDHGMGSSRQLCPPLSKWRNRRTESWWGTGVVNESHTEAVSGVCGRHMRPYHYNCMCMSAMMCGLCTRTIECLSMIKGMWVN